AFLHPAPLLGMEEDPCTPVMGGPRSPCKADEGPVVHLYHIPCHRGIDHELVFPWFDIIGSDLWIPSLYLDDLAKFLEGISFFQDICCHLCPHAPGSFSGHLEGDPSNSEALLDERPRGLPAFQDT